MRVSLNSSAKVLSTNPVSINSVSIYNPNDVHAFLELHNQIEGVESSTPYRTLEAPPLATLSIGGSSGLVLRFSSGLTAVTTTSLTKDLICDFN